MTLRQIILFITLFILQITRLDTGYVIAEVPLFTPRKVLIT